jgi:hypothetical protein
MESFIIAGIAMLILLPVLYFVPLGFTSKGKVFIVVASFLTGAFGLVASWVFPLWQTGLILLFFVIAIAYLISKRGEKWLYQPEEEYEDPFLKDEVKEELPEKQIKDTYTYIASSDNVPKEEKVKNVSAKKNGPMLSLDKLIPKNEKDIALFPKSDEEIDGIELQSLQAQESGENQVLAKTEIKDQEELLVTDIDMKDEDFIQVQEVETPAPVLKESYDYMADLEKMLDIEELSLDTPSQAQPEKVEENQPKNSETLFKLEELDDLEEIIFPKTDEKKQEHSIEESNTVKQ